MATAEFSKFAVIMSAALSQHHPQSIAVTKFLIAMPPSKPTSNTYVQQSSQQSFQLSQFYDLGDEAHRL